jgi:hypothetical protein
MSLITNRAVFDHISFNLWQEDNPQAGIRMRSVGALAGMLCALVLPMPSATTHLQVVQQVHAAPGAPGKGVNEARGAPVTIDVMGEYGACAGGERGARLSLCRHVHHRWCTDAEAHRLLADVKPMLCLCTAAPVWHAPLPLPHCSNHPYARTRTRSLCIAFQATSPTCRSVPPSPRLEQPWPTAAPSSSCSGRAIGPCQRRLPPTSSLSMPAH